VTNNLTLKVISLIMGFTFWFVWSDKQPTSCRVDVPLCVYNVPENAQFDAPETVKIQLSGKLKDLYDLDLDNLAVHIDGATLREGNNQCIVKNEQLLMPDDVKMTHCKPSNIMISYNPSLESDPSLASHEHASDFAKASTDRQDERT
jgi:hypothetical protein